MCPADPGGGNGAAGTGPPLHLLQITLCVLLAQSAHTPHTFRTLQRWCKPEAS